ncbi:MAG: MBL fold metallo-hydrolase [Gammaproteobacteria bacterium]
MRVRFWGTRGSLPVALTAEDVSRKVAHALLAADGRRFDSLHDAQTFAEGLPFHLARTYGGHSSCVQIVTEVTTREPPEYVLCDLGSGVRPFGNAVIARHGARCPLTFHVFMSHLHWDHLMGFPLFTPAYIPGNRIRIYGCHAELEQAFRRQHGAPSFPVEFDQLGATIEFVQLAPDIPHQVAGMQVTALSQLHAGDSYGYRFDYDGRSVVYSTDSEHKLDDYRVTEQFVAFIRDADLVIFDAMYSLAEAVSIKEDWGHSSNVTGVELCQLAGARRLALFHHEPVHDDERIATIDAETRRFEEITRDGRPPLQVVTAYDGLEIDLA